MGPPPSRREVVTTDASLSGWGGVWQHRGVSGLWDPHWTGCHINVLELQAVVLTLRHFDSVLVGKHVLIRTDNTSVVFHINHQGGTRSLPSFHLTRTLLTWAESRFLSLRAIHVHLNSAADCLSRGGPRPTNWQLHREVVLRIWDVYGMAAVDLFASRETTHCPLWFAERYEIGSLGGDALAHEWPDLLLYAFPPTALLWAVLNRVRERSHRLLLIAPRWPSMPWFHLLLSLTTGTCCPRWGDPYGTLARSD